MSNRLETLPSRLRALGVLALSAAVACGACGCGGTEDGGARQNPAPPAATSATSSAPAGAASPTTGGNQQTATALQAVDTAEGEVRGGKVFDLEEETVNGQRVWSAKVADPNDRPFDLVISQDGGSVISNAEDKTPDDDLRKFRSAKISLQDAVDTAVQRAQGQGNLTSLEVDTHRGNNVVWQIEFGGDDGTTVLVDANSGKVLAVGPALD